jgi:hypothetical protein
VTLDERLAQLCDDIRSGEVGPNILCRQLTKLVADSRAEGIEAAARACRTEADKLKKAGLMIRHDTALDCVVAVRAFVPDREGK